MEPMDRRERPHSQGSKRSRPMDNLELVEGLCGASVALREARRLHLQAYGTLIPHVFMAEVLKRIGQCLSMGAANGLRDHGPEIAGILEKLEQGMAEGDRETRNVIAISFSRDSEIELFFDELRPLLGPKTRAQLNGR
jgi:hypothetical protein